MRLGVYRLHNAYRIIYPGMMNINALKYISIPILPIFSLPRSRPNLIAHADRYAIAMINASNIT